MMKTKIALAAMMLSLALSPVDAATKSKKSNAPAKTAVSKKSSSKSKTSKSSSKSTKGGKSGGKNASKSRADKAKPAVASQPLPAERRQDKAFDSQANQFLGALWRVDPETAISVGKYDTAAQLTVPDQANRDQQLAFINEWLEKFGKIDARQLSPKQRSDLGLLQNKLNSDRWYLTTFREWEWNPAIYNIAGPIDFVLNTEYAARPQRLRTLLRRIGSVPAYYDAARDNIKNPTREQVTLAIDQAPGVLAVLSDLDTQAQDSILNATEKNV